MLAPDLGLRPPGLGGSKHPLCPLPGPPSTPSLPAVLLLQGPAFLNSLPSPLHLQQHESRIPLHIARCPTSVAAETSVSGVRPCPSAGGVSGAGQRPAGTVLGSDPFSSSQQLPKACLITAVTWRSKTEAQRGKSSALGHPAGR